MIRRSTAFPLADLQRLLQWALFNLVVGNSDAHGKNLSLLYDDQRVPRLAPFYDLVCTRNDKTLSRELAMNLGGAWDPDLVKKTQLEQLAAELGFRANTVLSQFALLLERIASQLPAAVEGFAQHFGDSPILKRVPIIIRKNLRRLSR